MKPLSNKYQGITPSITLSINAKAKALKAEGHDVLSFASGEPDQNTPKHIRDKAIERIEHGDNGYTAASGLAPLKEAIRNKLFTDNTLKYDSSDIIVSSGAKHALFNTIQAICNPGDEVIQIAPYWVSYPELIKMAGATPQTLHTAKSDDFLPRKDALTNLINENTKAIIINSPNNPTGVVYPRKTLAMIAQVAEAYDLYIISDEIYEKLTYDDTHHSIATISDDAFNRTILINGLSKAYAMTGWRIGYSASNPAIATIINAIQSHATSNANTIAQHASITALNEGFDKIEAMRQTFESRRNLIISALDDIKAVDYIYPTGAFYVMVDISGFQGKTHKNKTINNALDFCELLLEEALIATIPGEAFGAKDYIRFSYATDETTIKSGMQRFKTFIESLQNMP